MRSCILALGIITICILSVFTEFSSAMTTASILERNDNKKRTDQATGLFGGVRQDGTFVFLYSETKGVRFYRTVPGVRAITNGASYDLATLPFKTPIKISVRDGRITGVELQGVNK